VLVCNELRTTLSLSTESPDVSSSGPVRLYRQPPGPVLLGDTVNVICHVTDRHVLDIVRLVRRRLHSQDTRHNDVITTNGVIEDRFKAIGRYSVIEWNERGLIQLQITGESIPVLRLQVCQLVE